jgi:nitrite reductase/ring-hydroxylating ferredoxin subunit
VKAWHDLGPVEQLERDGRIIARVEGREIGVVLDRKAGSLHALRNRCPHVGSPLCRGPVRARERGTAGLYQPPERQVLRCPHHGWEFDLETGVCLEDAAMRVAVFPVKVEDARVLVFA